MNTIEHRVKKLEESEMSEPDFAAEIVKRLQQGRTEPVKSKSAEEWLQDAERLRKISRRSDKLAQRLIHANERMAQFARQEEAQVQAAEAKE
jgi:hypothetical protein